MWHLFGFCRGFRGKPWFMSSPLTRCILCLIKKSHFPHFSSTVVFHLQPKSNKRMSGGFGREPSLCWNAEAAASRGAAGRTQEGDESNLRSLPGRPRSAAMEKSVLWVGEKRRFKVKRKHEHPLFFFFFSFFCCSSSFKIMFRFHVLLITYTGVVWYVMPGSDGCSIILYKREHICFLRLTAHNLLLYNAEYFEGWCLSVLSIKARPPRQ